MPDTEELNQQQSQQENTEENSGQTAQQNSKQYNFEQVRKQLSERDKTISELNEKLAAIDKQKAAENNDIKKLLEIEQQEKNTLKSNIEKYEARIKQSHVLNSLVESGINKDLIDIILPGLQEKIEFDSELTPTNIDSLITELKASKPSLFIIPEKQSVPAGQVGTSIANGNNNQTIDPSKLTDPSYVADNLDAVTDYIKKNRT